MHRRGVLRVASVVATVLIGFSLSGCGSINSYLAEKTPDVLPSWLGGLPENAPPRPSDLRYPAYERALHASAGAPVKIDGAKSEGVK